MNSFLNWLDDRTGFREVMHEALYERIPGGARWRYVWGSTLVFAFMTQVITGVFLWMAYSPSSTTAWESVYYITYEMQFGWLLRGLHHFMAQAMVVLLAIHLMQVIIDGAYKAPREINFWLGLILMQIVLGLSLTGYLLPWDQKGFWATQVATKLMTLVPVIGTKLQRLVVGGPTYGHHTLTRFFAMHAGVLPGLLIAFLALHIAAFRRHGITVKNPLYRRDSMFWPDQVLKDAVACLGVLMVVLLLTIFLGAELGAPADPSQPYSAARPEWYFLFLFQFLKYFPGETEIWGALIIPGLLFGVLALMPFLGKWKLGHRFNVAYMLLMLAGILLLTGQAWMEDNRGPKAADYQRAVADAEMKAHRVRELIEISEGISEKGGRALLRSDPKTAGPELFKTNCSVCHSFDGHDGTGRALEKVMAADLGGFGSREWLKGFIVDPGGPKYFGATVNGSFNGQPLGDRFANGAMSKWAKEHAAKMSSEEIAAVVEFLLAQGDRSDLGPVDQELAAKGREVFELGSLDANAEGAEERACLQCHEMKIGGTPLGTQGMAQAPELTDYGSEKWLRDFVLNPDAPHNYGDRNAMPSYKDRMTQEEFDILLKWLRRQWLEAKPGTTAAH
jgi:ubiquinol-cytochrome c reductase cytochrome b subunit